MPQIHNQQRAQHVRGRRNRNDDPAAYAHKDQQHADDERQRHQEVNNKTVNGVAHPGRLIVKQIPSACPLVFPPTSGF